MRLTLAVALCSLLGCGSRDEGTARRPVYPVDGQLFVSGIPAANAQIAFHRLGEGSPAPLTPVGRAGPDGTFRLTTFATGDGAPAGEYVVTFVWPNDAVPVDECADPAAHDRLNGYYADPARRRLLATVRPGPNPITLRVEVGDTGWSLPRPRDGRR